MLKQQSALKVVVLRQRVRLLSVEQVLLVQQHVDDGTRTHFQADLRCLVGGARGHDGKAAGFDRSLYLTFAVLMLDRDTNAMGRAREYGELYEALPREAAQRTIRFWRVRRNSADIAA